MIAELAELGQWVATMATCPAPAPVADMEMDTGGDEVQRKRKDTFDGLLSTFEFDGDTEQVKLTAEEKLLLA